MYSKTKYTLAAAMLFLLAACSSALYIPTSLDAERSGIAADRLLLGRTLYVNRCGNCHNLHLPEQFTREKWLNVMPAMQKKAKITAEESKLITDFLLARSKEE